MKKDDDKMNDDNNESTTEFPIEIQSLSKPVDDILEHGTQALENLDLYGDKSFETEIDCNEGCVNINAFRRSHSLSSMHRSVSFSSCNDLVGYGSLDEYDDESQDKEDSKNVGCTTPLRRTKKGSKRTFNLKRDTLTLYPAAIGSSFVRKHLGHDEFTEEEILMTDGDMITKESDLRPCKLVKINEDTGVDEVVVKCRSFHIVTTAALPWMTGTAVNPILRAAYFNKMNREAYEVASNKVDSDFGKVTLVIPWLVDRSDHDTLYGDKFSFETPADQEAYIREWLHDSANLPLESSLEHRGIHILFYPAAYSQAMLSIFPAGDICTLIKNEESDVCFLEEPEHLNVFKSYDSIPWTKKFKHVVGIIHTNYKAYAKAHAAGVVATPLVSLYSSLITRAHCHKIVKLSATLQSYAPEKEVVNNVHGIRSDFVDEGKRRSQALNSSNYNDGGKIYFIGKLLWAKGLDLMIHLQYHFKKTTGSYFPIDIYGSGPEEDEIKEAFLGKQPKSSERTGKSVKGHMKKLMDDLPKTRFPWKFNPIPAEFPGRKDHASLKEEYKIFVNPSKSEVLCTTSAEALAMGKFVVIPRHPSNSWFSQFPNCLMYETDDEFASQLQYAVTNQPIPLSDEDAHQLTWEAATERCIEASSISNREFHRRQRLNYDSLDKKALQALKFPVFATVQRIAGDKITESARKNEKI